MLRVGHERTILVHHEQHDCHWPHLRPAEVPSWLYLSSVGTDSHAYEDQIVDWLESEPQVSLAFEPGTLQIARGAAALDRLFRRASLVVCNREEAAKLTGGNRATTPCGCSTPWWPSVPDMVVITDGSAGAFGSDGTARYAVPVFPDDGPVVDRTGAGDAFAGTLVAGVAAGLPLDRAMARAPVNSMRVVQQVGSQAGLLDAATVEALLAARPGGLRRAGARARPLTTASRRTAARRRPVRRTGDRRGPGPLRCTPVPRPPLLLLPPSEGKAAGGRRPGRPDSFADELAGPRAAVLAELGRVLRRPDARTRAAVLGVRGELLDRALAATGELVDGTAPVLPAWRRYSGVVWAGLDPATLAPADRRRILVPSALYGLTTAADPVADYRLKLLVVARDALGRLSTFWRPSLTPALAARARGRVVVDLLPAEHAHAARPRGPGRRRPGWCGSGSSARTVVGPWATRPRRPRAGWPAPSSTGGSRPPTASPTTAGGPAGTATW